MHVRLPHGCVLVSCVLLAGMGALAQGDTYIAGTTNVWTNVTATGNVFFDNRVATHNPGGVIKLALIDGLTNNAAWAMADPTRVNGDRAYLEIRNTMTIAGTGTFDFAVGVGNGFAQQSIYGTDSSVRLTIGTGQEIRGYVGFVGTDELGHAKPLALTNDGVIHAAAHYSTYVPTSPDIGITSTSATVFYNHNLVKASNGGQVFLSAVVDNTGGNFLATGSSGLQYGASAIKFEHAIVTGGTISAAQGAYVLVSLSELSNLSMSTDASGTINVATNVSAPGPAAHPGVWTNVTVNGNVSIPVNSYGSTRVTIHDELTSNASWTAPGSTATGPNTHAAIGVDNSASILGTGTFTFSANGAYSHTVFSADASARLTIGPNQVFQGNVWFGADYDFDTKQIHDVTLTNQGSILANVHTTFGRSDVLFHTYAGTTFYNSGLVKGSNATVSEVHASLIDNTGGTFMATDGGTLMTFFDAAITGGTLRAQNSGKIIFKGGSQVSAATLDGAISVDLAGTLTLTNVSWVNAPAIASGNIKVSGVLDLGGQTLSLAGAMGPGGTLGGSGTIQGGLANGGVVSPGNSPGTLTVTADYSQTALGKLHMELDPQITGQYDQLIVDGSVSLAGALELALLSTPSLGEEFCLIDNQGGSPIAGTFAGLPEGAQMTAMSGATAVSFAVDYAGGDGNDLVLTVTALPEPGSVAVLALGAAGLLARRRRR